MAAATFQRRCCSTLVPFWSKDKDERHAPVVRTIRWSAIAAGRSAIPEGSCQHKKEPRPVNRPVAGREAPYVHAGRSRPGQPKYPLVEWPGASTPQCHRSAAAISSCAMANALVSFLLRRMCAGLPLSYQRACGHTAAKSGGHATPYPSPMPFEPPQAHPVYLSKVKGEPAPAAVRGRDEPQLH
jgi:hypothetical protein